MVVTLGFKFSRNLKLALAALAACLIVCTAPRVATADPVGAAQSFTIPSSDGFFAGVHGIAAGPDGNLWALQSNRNVISRFTTAGARTDFNGLSTVFSGGGACGSGGCNFASAIADGIALGSDD